MNWQDRHNERTKCYRRDESPRQTREPVRPIIGWIHPCCHCHNGTAVSVILRVRSRTRFPRLKRRLRDTRHFVVW